MPDGDVPLLGSSRQVRAEAIQLDRDDTRRDRRARSLAANLLNKLCARALRRRKQNEYRPLCCPYTKLADRCRRNRHQSSFNN